MKIKNKSAKSICFYIAYIFFFASVFAVVGSFIPPFKMPLMAILKSIYGLWVLYVLIVGLTFSMAGAEMLFKKLWKKS